MFEHAPACFASGFFLVKVTGKFDENYLKLEENVKLYLCAQGTVLFLGLFMLCHVRIHVVVSCGVGKCLGKCLFLCC